MSARSPSKHETPFLRKPGPQGLYRPEFEHDACGVGFVCQMKGVRSHDVVRDALRILLNLSHRGATGSDSSTGDGAGILLQMPHEFFLSAIAGFRLPDRDAYGAGLVFLPKDPEAGRRYEDWIESVVREEGQTLLGWRDVPVQEDCLGDLARRAAPRIRQVFVGRGAGLADDLHFERKLYVIRKRLERAVRESDQPGREFFYLPSLSHRTLVYKGLLLAEQVIPFFPDLSDERMVSALALVHQRYSTNTFPTWDLAQPFRFLCHNGEINTLRGNINWMNAREGLFRSSRFGADLEKIHPVLTPGASDSAVLDNALELLWHSGRSLPHAVSMLIPEAWENHEEMSDAKRAYYEAQACTMEPWDGPASIPFTDGRCIGAVLDRNGLRPSRYTVTRDGRVILASETGVLEIEPENVLTKGRLQPGRMLLIDLEEGRIVEDDEIKESLAASRPYRQWLTENLRHLRDLPSAGVEPPMPDADLLQAQRAFGFTQEDLSILLEPMAATGAEPIGSMGTDT
ncbi:MAG: glutamate synthase central domain-containing protein, partial [Kiritimatiellia bacterium]|nr:glutamate synthase central domain-containing protein [Kiritimatiellia bacterium]